MRQRLEEISALSNQPSAIALRERPARCRPCPVPGRHSLGGGSVDSRRGVSSAAAPWSWDETQPNAITWIINSIQYSVIEKEIFPDLAQKYFNGRAGLDYHVRCSNAAVPSAFNVSSGAGFGENTISRWMRSMSLFGPPFRRTRWSGPEMGLRRSVPRRTSVRRRLG